MVVSIFFLKLFARVGTESITLGLNSLMLVGMFLNASLPLFPEGTMPSDAPYDIIV